VIAQLRLAWRLQRWEFAFVVIGGLGLAAVAFWQAFDMRSMLTGCGTPSAAPACQFIYPFQETHGNVVLLTQMPIGLAPFVAGLLLGVPIVTREVEHRTALLAWPLAGSRARWLAWRVMPALIIGLAVMVVLAVADDLMAQAYLPKSDLGFLHHGSRGVPLVMRALVVLALGVALGALIGRLLPALLVGIALCVGIRSRSTRRSIIGCRHRC
jgi:ABC-type transport system involved in multi-copper enzyme maturation permease subunit